MVIVKGGTKIELQDWNPSQFERIVVTNKSGIVASIQLLDPCGLSFCYMDSPCFADGCPLCGSFEEVSGSGG